MGNTDIVSYSDTSPIIKIAPKINDGILADCNLTNMEEFATTMDARFAP